MYFIEITDTYGGEANYCWARRYLADTKTELAAIRKVAKHYATGWRREYTTGDLTRYNLKDAAICCFIEYVADDDLEARHLDKLTALG